MTDEYEFLPEDIIREIASYNLFPELRNLTFESARAERSLIPERKKYLSKLYPGWDKKIDVFSYTMKGNVFQKMVQAHDLDSIRLILKLHSHPASVKTALVYQAVQQEAIDVLQFLLNQ